LIKTKIGYALAGVSKFGEFCLEQYAEIDGLKPVAVWNRTPEKAAALAAKYRLRHHESLEALVADPEVQLVHVATIPALHAAHATVALRAGKHVLCEKPLATRSADAEAILALAEERQVQLGINFVMRYSPLWQPVEALVRERLLGAPLRAEVVNCAGDSGLPADHWFWDENQSGGIFIEHGVHFFDLIASWLGEGGIVTGADRLRRPGTSAIEQVSCNVRYGAETSAGFYHGFHQFDCLDRQQVRLIFERGELVLSGWVARKFELRAALPVAECDRVKALFPAAEITRFSDASGPSHHRGRDEMIDEALQLSWCDPRDGQKLYATAIRDLVTDFVTTIRDPAHVPRVCARDGLAALRQAGQAHEISKKTNP
jgi:predicted dehydrogenase